MKLVYFVPLMFFVSSCSIYFEPEFNYTDEQFRISQVVDGDTFIMNNGEYVRIIGIDAPERGEEGYHEASDFLRKFEGRNITIESEDSDRDQYGRLLRHVYVDNTSLAVSMLENDHAIIYKDYQGEHRGSLLDALTSNLQPTNQSGSSP